MKKTFKRIEPVISIYEFLIKTRLVKEFTSSNGRRYRVLNIENDEMLFRRLDADTSVEWHMNLINVYKAYSELADFKTINFKPYVPITHSPARGLLLYLGLISKNI